MKRLWSVCGLFCVALLMVACGPKEPLVEAKATDLNLAAGDLGAGYTLVEESDLATILGRTAVAPEDQAPLLDASRRVFVGAATLTTTLPLTGSVPITRSRVTVLVLVYNASGAAQTGLSETRDALKDVLSRDVALSAVSTTTLGDQSELWAAEMPDRGAKVYLLLVRRLNVVGAVMAIGPSDLGQTWVQGLGQAWVNRVPVPQK